MDYTLQRVSAVMPNRECPRRKIVPPKPGKGERKPRAYSPAELNALWATSHSHDWQAMITLNPPPSSRIATWPELRSLLEALKTTLTNWHRRIGFPIMMVVTEFDPASPSGDVCANLHIGCAQPLTEAQQKLFCTWWLKRFSLQDNRGGAFQHDAKGGGPKLQAYLAKDLSRRNGLRRPVKYAAPWLPARIETRLWFIVGAKRRPSPEGAKLRTQKRLSRRRFDSKHAPTSLTTDEHSQAPNQRFRQETPVPEKAVSGTVVRDWQAGEVGDSLQSTTNEDKLNEAPAQLHWNIQLYRDHIHTRTHSGFLRSCQHEEPVNAFEAPTITLTAKPPRCVYRDQILRPPYLLLGCQADAAVAGMRGWVAIAHFRPRMEATYFMSDSAYWLNKLRHLNPNRSRTKGAAPHKPCLLLSLLDMAQDGELASAELKRTPGLHARFNAFSSIALPRWGGKVDLTYPFYYLKSQGFWQALDAERHTARGVDATDSITLDPSFLAWMQDADFRRSARIVLVETYFPPEERVALYALLGVRAQTAEFQKELSVLKEPVAEYAVEQGRSARFSVQVVCGYQHTCALTGYRIITQSGESVVEAAHIEPWAKTRNNDIHNGLALSRNAHWAFDRGLWSVDDHFRVLVHPDRFQEWGPDDLGLMHYRGHMLQFAPQANLRPHPEYLRGHRKAWGFAKAS